MDRIVLKASDLDGLLTEKDKKNLSLMEGYYSKAMESFKVISAGVEGKRKEQEKDHLIQVYNDMGKLMQEIVKEEPGIRVYSFETPQVLHGEASRIIAKLRNTKTQHHEFVYYIQRAYEILFNLAVDGANTKKKNYFIINTPVNIPVQNFAVHKIPDIDHEIENSVMCVMLRGALLPSIIMSKEIQEYSSKGYVTPFALFRIKRNESKKEVDMEYILDLKKSYFNLELLDGKDLVFADHMNATGGSLVTIVKYLLDQGIKPRSIKLFNVISALKGSLRITRALQDVTIYTLWMDPVLNELAYIMPGLGDDGDRLNGPDMDDAPRNIIQLIADYGAGITSLYRSQVRKIEETVLNKISMP
ncbi:MAG: uracil phosphoribosyltransferase [Spirochaetales bacterium]|nr:MAG: uracil phosphoribosyltransferase [Spirochaetales bacterium]